VAWSVTFYSERVESDILDLAPGFVARFIRYAERMEAFGPDLGMPHTRAMGVRLVRTPDQGRGRNCAGVLLHGRRPTHRDSSPVREEDRQNTAQGTRDRAPTNEGSHMSTLKQFKRRALARPEVKAAYDASADEFAFLDEVLRARAEAGLTQAEVAARIGTTQSAIARLESAEPKHSPSIATLQRYAKALGYTVELRLVKERRPTTRSRGRTARAAPRPGRRST